MATTSTCLWFDNEGEEAAAFYTSVLPNSRILGRTRYSAAMPERAGQVMTVEFELDGKPYVALNAGPQFEFTEAISIQINCDSQEEVDEYWSKLTEGGEEGPCGWLKDRYGLSWQVVPNRLTELMADSDTEQARRVTERMLQMKKLDIAELEMAAADVEVSGS
jgi:predicted 3-demethylubiquinone-9 3-methyltransferase (glyoxalase superfamily)